MVASIATKENHENLAKKVKTMPMKGLVEWVRGMRKREIQAKILEYGGTNTWIQTKIQDGGIDEYSQILSFGFLGAEKSKTNELGAIVKSAESAGSASPESADTNALL